MINFFYYSNNYFKIRNVTHFKQDGFLRTHKVSNIDFQ